MHYLSQIQDGPSTPDHGRHLVPVILTADAHYHTILTGALPDLRQHCFHTALLQTATLKNRFGNNLLLFVDIDSYGATALQRFMGHRQDLRPAIIGLSDCEDLKTVIGYLKSGIRGYFLKNEMNAELVVHAIMTLLNNGFPLSAGITQKIIHDLIAVQQVNYEALLSGREQDILRRLVHGGSYKMIASELDISVETVRHHIKNLYKKLGVNSKGEVIAKILNPANNPPFM
ncbi:response regulator transcription factor [Chitinophaga japonensis]|uniref:Regulatory LuxR family protein n=1 Tax=Chitinophaga japonensis TaxID=104662 RepID=A0A562TGV6_CHIJA|nr:response regulator transcription factor [Chitinophaga japonensis]TWI92246.1 regulatory LuxR family protein [Chitinophaga japonensis]